MTDPFPATIPLRLDGVTDLPPGKIATLVAYLEMADPSAARPARSRDDLALRKVVAPDVVWYRDLYRKVGQRWLWFMRAMMTDAELAAVLADPATEVFAAWRSGQEIGFVELNRSVPGEVEIAFFGLVPDAVGEGIGPWMMGEALRLAWTGDVTRVWLHTCHFDHPAALGFYQASGFHPYKLALGVTDDPRLTGHLPRTAGPHVPLLG